MSNKNIYQRSYHLTIVDELTGVSKTYTNLDIKFRIKKVMAPTRYTAKISVLGLSWETMNNISATSLYDITTAAQKLKKRIILKAGYVDNEVEIFGGYIVAATIQSPPDMWLNMTVCNYVDFAEGSKSLSYGAGMTAKQIAFAVSDSLKIPIVYKCKNQEAATTKLGPTVISGNWSAIFKRLQKLASWEVFYDNGFIYIADNSFADLSNELELTFNKRTGLIKVNSIDFISCSITTFLNQNANLSNIMNVESELMPVVNGKYRIFTKEYFGHFRGKEWYSTFYGMRINRKK